MLEFLKTLDVQILLWVNSFHTPFLDSIMLFITHRYTWIPLYLFIIIFLFVKEKKAAFWIVGFIIVSAVCSDLFASSLMKPLFHRLRPCHNQYLQGVLYVIEGVCGGKYGFVSSHAANTFSLATFLYLLFGKENRWILLFFIWAGIVSMSRVYLGVHYPADITVGALAGTVIAWLFFMLFTFMKNKSVIKY